MKAKRQEKIIEIIEEYDIETQDELAEKLQEVLKKYSSVQEDCNID